MARAGAHALLVGEALVLSGDVTATARELMLVGVTPSAGETGDARAARSGPAGQEGSTP